MSDGNGPEDRVTLEITKAELLQILRDISVAMGVEGKLFHDLFMTRERRETENRRGNVRRAFLRRLDLSAIEISGFDFDPIVGTLLKVERLVERQARWQEPDQLTQWSGTDEELDLLIQATLQVAAEPLPPTGVWERIGRRRKLKGISPEMVAARLDHLEAQNKVCEVRNASDSASIGFVLTDWGRGTAGPALT